MRIELLDHGYIEFIESWGSDERIIEAARMSTSKSFQGWGPKHADQCEFSGVSWTAGQSCPHGCATPGDEKLLAYLWNNKHATPFEMAGLIIEVQAPIFVFREWHRHRTQSYNELSARYTPLPDMNYMPEVQRLMMAGGANKQASSLSGETLTEVGAADWLEGLEELYAQVESHYRRGLQMGVPKELARVIVPVGRYSRMRASANLRNWLGFLTLRMAPAAQYEIRQYANAVGSLIERTFPRTWELFEKGV